MNEIFIEIGNYGILERKALFSHFLSSNVLTEQQYRILESKKDIEKSILKRNVSLWRKRVAISS
jgi:hypothetical protein